MKDVRYHNIISPKLEYYVTVAGYNINSKVFFEKVEREGKLCDRFFAAGNEVLFDVNEILFEGLGGGLCEYMFGIDQPLPDLLRKDVVNRLIIFGAFHSMLYDKIIFTEEVKGRSFYDDIFLRGHAVNNYYFFIQSDYKGASKARQEKLCKKIGKVLKRSKLVGITHDEALAKEILNALDEARSTLILIRLKNICNEKYYQMFKDFYEKNRRIIDEEKHILQEYADAHQIPQYQRERMQIDIIYKHYEHKHIVDEYKDILIQGQKKRLSDFQKARLKRLRTLSMRNNIPSSLFDTLDELLLESKEALELYEPEYLKESRIILESIFIHSEGLEFFISNEDLQKLLLSKKTAVQLRDNSFEELLLEIGRLCDEIIRDKGDIKPLENFSYIIAYFDRFDSCANFINKISFMQDSDITESTVRSLYGSMIEFDKIAPDLFDKLFIEELYKDKYLTRFGYKKVKTLVRGFKKMAKNEISLGELVSEISQITYEEKLYNTIHKFLAFRMKNYYWDLASKKEILALENETSEYLALISFKINAVQMKEIFDKVIFDLKKESFYIRNIVPRVVKNNDIKSREDFIENSGLDRFFIEELERHYFEEQAIDVAVINAFQELTQSENR